MQQPSPIITAHCSTRLYGQVRAFTLLSYLSNWRRFARKITSTSIFDGSSYLPSADNVFNRTKSIETSSNTTFSGYSSKVESRRSHHQYNGPTRDPAMHPSITARPSDVQMMQLKVIRSRIIEAIKSTWL